MSYTPVRCTQLRTLFSLCGLLRRLISLTCHLSRMSKETLTWIMAEACRGPSCSSPRSLFPRPTIRLLAQIEAFQALLALRTPIRYAHVTPRAVPHCMPSFGVENLCAAVVTYVYMTYERPFMPFHRALQYVYNISQFYVDDLIYSCIKS